MAYGIGKGSVEHLGSATRSANITASNTVEIEPTRGIFCQTAGDAVLLFEGDTSTVTMTLVAGAVYPFCIRRLHATGTTAVIRGLW